MKGFPDKVVSGRGVPTIRCRRFIGEELMRDEVLVLAHIGAGRTDRDMAKLFGWSLGQVRWAVRNAIAKLGARDRPHALCRAMALGYLDVSTSGR